MRSTSWSVYASVISMHWISLIRIDFAMVFTTERGTMPLRRDAVILPCRMCSVLFCAHRSTLFRFLLRMILKMRNGSRTRFLLIVAARIRGQMSSAQAEQL